MKRVQKAENEIINVELDNSDSHGNRQSLIIRKRVVDPENVEIHFDNNSTDKDAKNGPGLIIPHKFGDEKITLNFTGLAVDLVSKDESKIVVKPKGK